MRAVDGKQEIILEWPYTCGLAIPALVKRLIGYGKVITLTYMKAEWFSIGHIIYYQSS